MLAEAVKYLAARLRGQGDPHGHLVQQVAIWARHRRHSTAWAPHLERARALALAAARACPADRRRTALVLGAGLLLDVPLDELASLYTFIILVDMAFLPEVRAKARRLGNVELLEADLTGLLARLHDQPGGLPGGPPPDVLGEIAARLRDRTGGVDFAYSANLLSQLPLFALEALPGLDAERGQELAAGIVRRHLEGLRGLGCPACLVTDVLERGLRRGEPVYEAGLLFGVDPALAGETWTWRMAPRGEAKRGLDVERVVLGVANVRTAGG